MFFVELLRNYKVVIPKIQRDYAQGRAKYNKSGVEITSEKPYQVRTGLVNALYDSLDGKKVDLNFVYGKKEMRDGRLIFIPIDGQQRLTTLFLFHWYVYQRANLFDEIKRLGESFSYDTRDTTKHFCDELCRSLLANDVNDEERITNLQNVKDDSKKQYRLSAQVMDRIWFTSSYANDPSVRSMLIMLDSIEEKFVVMSKYKTANDFVGVAITLQESTCPITFSYLDVQDFDDEDMYIKMNARGKELTNFEIFKARLEEGKILQDVCYVEADLPAIKVAKTADFIGKYNNEFTNLFYGMPEIGKNFYDSAIFRFVECFIKLDHLAYITGRTKVSEDYYYSEVSNTNYTGASLFNDYVLNPTLHGYKKENSEVYIDALREKAKYSIVKITGILDFFVKNGFDVLPNYKNSIKENNTTYDERQLFISNIKDSSSLMLVTQYALFSFLHLMECGDDFDNKKDAYLEWKRFVCNVTFRFVVKDPVNFAKMTGVFEEILLEIQNKYETNGKMICNRNILEIIADYNSILAIKEMPMDVIRHIFERESYKAKLMLDSSDGYEWNTVIREAEEYYYDGDISFIFDLIKDKTLPVEFKKAFEKSRQWIGKDKNPNDVVTLNEALLCMDYPEEFKKIAHMRIYSYGEVWQLYYGSEKQRSVRESMADKERNRGTRSGLLELISNYDISQTPRQYTDNLIATYKDIPECWLRNILIRERLIKKMYDNYSKWPFSGTIGQWSQAVKDEYVLFYSTAYNSYNLEFNTFRLAMQLIGTHPEVEIDISSGKVRSREKRYVKLNEKKVSYDMEIQRYYCINTQSYFNANDGDLGMAEAVKYMLS